MCLRGTFCRTSDGATHARSKDSNSTSLQRVTSAHMMPTQANLTERWAWELQSRLNLSPEQMQKIKPVIRNTLGGFKDVLVADALAALTNCNAQIAVELTPDQKVKFEQLSKEQRNFIQIRLGGQAALQPKASVTN